MTEQLVLAELGLQVFVPREAEAAPTKAAIYLAETKAAFSPEHHTQLKKIMEYLGYPDTEYVLIFADDTAPENAAPLLSFGTEHTSIHTHSISAMLQQPAIKREVLHVIQPLRRNA